MFIKNLLTGLSLSNGIFPFIKNPINTGIIVMDRIAEIAITIVFVRAKGVNNLPS